MMYARNADPPCAAFSLFHLIRITCRVRRASDKKSHSYGLRSDQDRAVTLPCPRWLKQSPVIRPLSDSMQYSGITQWD